MMWDSSITNFGTNLAVVIGINNYQNGIHPLKTAVNDAAALADLLETNYNYQVLRLFPYEENQNEATLENINTLLSETLTQKIQSPEVCRLLFYFAGHGIARNGENGPAGYLVPQNAHLGKIETFLPMQRLYKAFMIY
ncbi:caspase family protein [Microseira sp. BLCC-F43]|jgi:uncharacterized caspase-like protein|uniref:caspase family protein n=1 Tax=Microseira sp. BLCC-F43 TaxID=3153602 RepID=UPI0035B7FE3B